MKVASNYITLRIVLFVSLAMATFLDVMVCQATLAACGRPVGERRAGGAAWPLAGVTGDGHGGDRRGQAIPALGHERGVARPPRSSTLRGSALAEATSTTSAMDDGEEDLMRGAATIRFAAIGMHTC